MPAVVFTDPQVATVGLTDAEARAKGKKVPANRKTAKRKTAAKNGKKAKTRTTSRAKKGEAAGAVYQQRLQQERDALEDARGAVDQWYPYFTRRLAERPANALFMLKNMFKK